MCEGDQREPGFAASRWSALIIRNADINRLQVALFAQYAD